MRLSNLTERGADDFTFMTLLVAASGGQIYEANDTAKRFASEYPEVASVFRAAVAAGTISDVAWAATLAEYTQISEKFVEALRPSTIVGQLEGLVQTAFSTRTIVEDSAGTAAWITSGKPIPLSRSALSGVTLAPRTIGALNVFTRESVRTISRANLAYFRRSLLKTVAAYMDAGFINPESAGVANLTPASVTYGITPTPATGATAAAMASDLGGALRRHVDDGASGKSSVWIMRARTALSLSQAKNTGGAFEFPKITVRGGELLGLPVIVSDALPYASGSPTDEFRYIVLLNPERIVIADDGLTTINLSENASLQMSDSPTDGAASLVSMYQTNSVAVAVTRYVNFQRASDVGSVEIISQVPY